MKASPEPPTPKGGTKGAFSGDPSRVLNGLMGERRSLPSERGLRPRLFLYSSRTTGSSRRSHGAETIASARMKCLPSCQHCRGQHQQGAGEAKQRDESRTGHIPRRIVAITSTSGTQQVCKTSVCHRPCRRWTDDLGRWRRRESLSHGARAPRRFRNTRVESPGTVRGRVRPRVAER